MKNLARLLSEPEDQSLADLMSRIWMFATYEHASSIVRAIECSEVIR